MPEYSKSPRVSEKTLDARMRRAMRSFQTPGSFAGKDNVPSLESSLLESSPSAFMHTSSDYTFVPPVKFVIVDASGGNVNITLPDPAAYRGVHIVMKIVDIASTVKLYNSDNTLRNTYITNYSAFSVVSDGEAYRFIFSGIAYGV